MPAAIHYTLRAPNPASHLIDVTLTIPEPDPDGQRLSMPVWIPGSYLVRDYARHVVQISATANGEAVAISPLDKASWQAARASGALTVTYTVYAWDRSVRGAHLDENHWYFNGPCVCLEVAGHADGEYTIDIEQPPIANSKSWQVATSMRPQDVDGRGFGRYTARSYDELIDQPVEIAKQLELKFEAAGVPHQFFIRGALAFDEARFVTDVRAICDEHHALLGTPEDFDRYVFLADASARGYGGLEHEHSTSLAISRSALPIEGRDELSDDYRKLLGLISHEYFHLWNVKRLRPAVFSPYEFTKEHHTELLWVFEGITSYYDDLGLIRAGVIDETSYLELLAQQITRVLRVPGRNVQSVAESSFYAWTKLYQRNENSDNTMISYYTKGSIVALALDLTLRSRGDLPLDELMRHAWSRYAIEQNGMPERAIEKLLVDHAQSDYSEFFERYVYGAEDPDFKTLFAHVGIDFMLRAQENESDLGGRDARISEHKVWWGMTTRKLGHGIKLTKVRNGSPAEAAGLAPDDLLIALNGLRLTSASFADLSARFSPGETVTLKYFRDDILYETALTFSAAPADRCFLRTNDDQQGRRHREAWCKSLQ